MIKYKTGRLIFSRRPVFKRKLFTNSYGKTDTEVLGAFASGTAGTRQALPPNQIMTEYMTEHLDKSRLVKFVSGKYQRTFPDGAIESYTAKGLLESRMTPEQRQMFYHRNESGNLDRLQLSTGDFFSFYYDARRNLPV